MRVLVGQFSSESNEHSRSLMTFEKFLFRFGEENARLYLLPRYF